MPSNVPERSNARSNPESSTDTQEHHQDGIIRHQTALLLVLAGTTFIFAVANGFRIKSTSNSLSSKNAPPSVIEGQTQAYFYHKKPKTHLRKRESTDYGILAHVVVESNSQDDVPRISQRRKIIRKRGSFDSISSQDVMVELLDASNSSTTTQNSELGSQDYEEAPGDDQEYISDKESSN